MPRVHGYVGVEETGEAVLDLIVSVRAATVQKAPPRLEANLFQHFSESLGSAITDDSGKFSIEVDLAVLTETDHKHSELILMVQAPVTLASASGPAPFSSQKRLLTWTELPGLAGSKSEAVQIQIPEEQIRRFRLRLANDRRGEDVDRKVERRVQAEIDNERFKTELRNRLAPMREQHYRRQSEIRNNARHFASRLHLLGESAPNADFWVPPRGNVDNQVRAAMNEGIDRIAMATGRRTNGVYLAMEDGEMRTAGFSSEELEEMASHPYAVDYTRMCALFNAVRHGPELLHMRDLLESRRPDDSDEDTSPDDDLDSDEQATSDAELRDRVLGQLRDMPLGGEDRDPTLPHTYTLEEINEKVPDFVLNAGPADLPAFHDFHQLQIAFPQVWTNAFDVDMESWTADLHQAYFELQEETGVELGDLPEFAEAIELESLLADIEGIEGSVTSLAIPSGIEYVLHWGGCSIDVWFRMDADQRAEIELIADRRPRPDVLTPEEIRTVAVHCTHPRGALSRLERLRIEIASRLREPYSFDYFAPGAINFGMMLTYRQRWEPIQYQTGDLIATIPLAPGEKRKFSTKQVVKRTRAETELEKAMSSRRRELNSTRRADAEIVAKASRSSNFKMTAEGSVDLRIAEISSSTEFALDQSQESSRVTKDFREAVLKAAQEYKQERSLKVDTTDELTSETSSSGELSNPNNELTVTYLLYELERQYKISERIHRVTPVVLVPQDVPAPHEITESWLLAHDWILRRVMLDDSMLESLDYLSNAFAGDEMDVSVRKVSWQKQLDLITELEATIKGYKSDRDDWRDTLIRADEEIRRFENADDDTQAARILRAIFTGGISELAPKPDDIVSGETAILRQTAEERLKYLEETLAQAQARFTNAQESLNQATDAYTRSLESQTNRRVSLDKLRIHVKKNILYYMQAIWDHEPPDQRYFRLYNQTVELPQGTSTTCYVRLAREGEVPVSIPIEENGRPVYVVENCEPPALGDVVERTLVDIADLDRPLGYKGNYIIFPLKTCLYLTDYMMQEYFDGYFGVRDPDLMANFTAEDLLQYTEELLNDESVNLNTAQREALARIVEAKLRSRRRDSDIVVVPTGEVFMEALAGNNALLEEFKLKHRAYDMANARAEWREAELENLRKAARLLQEEPDLDDPDVDKRIVVEGTNSVHVETPD